MNVVHLHPGPDTGGKSMAAKAALEGDNVRVFARTSLYFDYPAAEPWDLDEIRAAYEAADLVVYHNEPALLHSLVGGFGAKPLMVHHHGSILRRGGDAKWREGEELGALQVVSTLDLLRPGGHWLPQIVDLSAMRAIRERVYSPTLRLRVSHAPTSRQSKGTRTILAAVRKLKGVVEWDLISRKPWQECLARKARSDLYVDQLTWGFGANGIECAGMGIPILGAAPEWLLDRMREAWGGLPFYAVHPSREGVMEALQTFAVKPVLRAEWAERGRLHAQRFHDVPAWTARFRELAHLTTA